MSYADLELSLRRWGGDDYAVEARFRLSESAAEAQLISGSPPRVRLDFDELLEFGPNPQAYGAALSGMLFSDSRVSEALAKARTQAETAGVPLRLRLRLAADDDEIHALRWETLHGPDGSALAQSERILFSRHLDSADMTPFTRGERGDVRAFVAVAGPNAESLASYKLAPVDVAGEVERIQAALGDIPTTVLAQTTGTRTTLDHLTAALRDGAEIVCIVAHGTLRRGRTYLWLEDEQGEAERVAGDELVEAIARLQQRPLLLVLISCQSAGDGDAALAALGPQLAAAGIAAVIAMQGNLSMASAAKLLPTFFRELRRDGQVDRALAAARTTLRNNNDWWQPALFLRVPDGKIWLEAAPTATASTTARIPPPPQPEQPPDLSGFVGRTNELAGFEATLKSTSLVVLTGMPGVGKTSMAAALARSVGQPDSTFWHSFHNGESLESLLWDLAGFLAHIGHNGLWTMLQETRLNGVQPPPPKVQIDYFMQLLEQAEILICLDDLHLVDDDPQLELLIERLGPLLRRKQVRLIITSWRVPEFAALTQIEMLTGLTEQDAEALLIARDIHLAPDLMQRLYRQIGGNAQLLTLAADALQRSNNPARLIDSLTEADSIERYLLNTIDGVLNTAERNTMKPIAALLEYGGTRHAIEHLADGAGIRRPLRDLTDRHLLLSQESALGKEYRQHGIVQQFYYEEIGRRERIELHQRAAEHYVHTEPDPLRAAIHHEYAGASAQALDIALRHRDEMINRGQARQLLRLLEHINTGRLSNSQQSSLWLLRGETATLLNMREQAQRDFSALLDSASDPTIRARACRGMAQLRNLESPSEAIGWLERGLQELAEHDHLEAARIQRRRGSALMNQGNLDAAEDALRQSLAQLSEHEPADSADVYLNLGIVHCMRGNLQHGAADFQQALQLYQHSGQIWSAVGAQQNLAQVRELLGDWHGAATAYQATLADAVQLGLIQRQIELALAIGTLRINQGQLSEAAVLLNSARELAEREHLQLVVLRIDSSRAIVNFEQGDDEATAATLDTAEALAAKLETRDQLPEIYRTRARLQLKRGDPTAATTTAEQAVQAALDLGDGLAEGAARRVLGQALAAAQRTAEALEQFAASATLLGDDPYELARTRAAWAVVLQDDDPTQAAALREQARSVFSELGAQRDLLHM